jgi:serine/threonine protein kinase
MAPPGAGLEVGQGAIMFLQVDSQPIPGLRLTRPLGAGAFGDVWEARNADGKFVALKFMDCRTKSSSMIAGEIRILRGLAGLKHPNFIQLLDVYASSHYIILSMERADGNLADLQRVYLEETGKNIPPDHLLELLDQVAVGLDYLAGLRLPGFNVASRGLQHCDIKPSNLLLLGDTVKIADFGLCAGANWQTHRNAWKGTPPYAAPELYRGQATVGTDQFALAVTFLKLCAGDRAFFPTKADDGPPVMPVDLTKLRERELPILSRALHPQPSARWPSCQAFLTALREAIHLPRRSIEWRRPSRSVLRPTRPTDPVAQRSESGGQRSERQGAPEVTSDR